MTLPEPVDLVCPACQTVFVSVSSVTTGRDIRVTDLIMCALCGEISQLADSGSSPVLVEPDLTLLLRYQRVHGATIQALQARRLEVLRQLQAKDEE